MKYELILLAAGKGNRMQTGENKLLLQLVDKPVIAYALEVFLNDPNCQQILLVGKSEDFPLLQKVIESFGSNASHRIQLIEGAEDRQGSVYQGLCHVKEKEGRVWIHDGARPFVTQAIIDRVNQSFSDDIRAVITGMPTKDTMKKVGKEGQIIQTVPREVLWHAQTPQVFEFSEIMFVHKQAAQENYTGTDDASLVEKYGHHKVHMVMGSYENIKLTTPEDMLVGEMILNKRRREQTR